METFKNISTKVKAIAVTLIILVIGCSAFAVSNHIKYQKEKQELEANVKEFLVSANLLNEALDNFKTTGYTQRLAVYQLREKYIISIKAVYVALFGKLGEDNHVTKEVGKYLDVLNNKQKAEKPNYDSASQEAKDNAKQFCEVYGLNAQMSKIQAASIVVLLIAAKD